MNKQSNTYIIVYSVVLVVVVAVALAFTAMKLQVTQQRNVEIEKKTDILNSAGLYKEEPGADKNAAVEAQYNTYIKQSFLVNAQGEEVQSADPAAEALKVLNNMKAALAEPEAERELPVFISEDGEKKNYIFPVYGAGLWGPVWGYIAMNSDLKTISGAVFAHKSETPGLGAEIATPAFGNQFIGKSIFKDGQYVGIYVLKGAGSSQGNDNAVDAISGGTITSRAVQAMIIDNLKFYLPYILKQQAAAAQ